MSTKNEQTPENDPKEIKDDPKKTKDSFTEFLPSKIYLPPELFFIGVESRPLFPFMIVPIILEKHIYIGSINKTIDSETKKIAIALKKNFQKISGNENEFYEIGVAANIIKIISSDKNTLQLIVETTGRIRIKKIYKRENALIAQILPIEEPKVISNDQIKAYSREIINNLKELMHINPLLREELHHFASEINIENPAQLADFSVSVAMTNKKSAQDILATIPILERLKKAIYLIKKELDLNRLQVKISKKIENRITKNQREFFLREQLKEIQKELGISQDMKSQEIEKYISRAAKLDFSPATKAIFDEEIQKMSMLDISSPDFSVVKNYLDWITALPWGIYAQETEDLQKAQEILDNDHYGLDEIKKRILEFIAVMQLTKKVNGTILCFVGPPGVGKTSLGKSIARTLNRPFYRFSVGGMNNEAEIKGHRRTYVGAMPGKFIQALKFAKKANPVVMIDEIDKIGNSYHGDPASALLEVLDPEQNNQFIDHYLDVPFDLSSILFITTANQLDTISPPLLDRMEVLRLSGYITEEKMAISKKYLIPKQRKLHGLNYKNCRFSDTVVKKIINDYARESGVRNLENQIKKICRKIAFEIASQDVNKASINTTNIEKYLNKPSYNEDIWNKKHKPGVVNGLAWTNYGGAILSIEAINISSEKGSFKQTGQLGNVMIESSQIAYSYAKAHIKKYGGKISFFQKNDIHLHVPAGATPKDGPSAGISIATTLISLALQKTVDWKIGMTGELTLSGNVLPIGGLKEKIIAAIRNNLSTILIPLANDKDYEELPEHLKKGLIRVHFIEKYDDIFKILF